MKFSSKEINRTAIHEAGHCDVKVADVKVWRSPIGQLADALHKLHGGEPHDGNRTNREATPDGGY